MKIEVGDTYAQAVFEDVDYMYVTKDGTEGAVVNDVFYETLDDVPREYVLFVEYLKVVYDEYNEKLNRFKNEGS